MFNEPSLIMEKRILLLLCLFLGLTSFAQDSYVEVGNGEEKINQPAYTSWEYSYCSLMYTSEELGEAKTITQLAFNNNAEDLTQYGADFYLENQKIWIKHSSEDCFTPDGTGYMFDYENPYNAENGYTLVYEGQIYYGPLGWQAIELQTPFDYNGTDNIILHFENEHGEVKYSFKNAGTKMEGNTMAIAWGGTDAVPHSSGYQYYNNNRVNIRFFFEAGNAPTTPMLVAPLNAQKKTDLDTPLTFNIGDNTTYYSVYFGESEDNLSAIASNVAVTEAGEVVYNLEDDLETNKTYFWQIIVGNEDESVESAIYSFTTQEIITEFPWTCDFEDYWVSTIDPEHPDTLSSIINTNFPEDTPWEFTDGWYALHRGLGYYEGSFSAKASAYQPGVYELITPRMDLPENQRISFYWINNGALATIPTTTLEISTDGKESWTVLKEMKATSTMEEYKMEIIDLAAYNGNNVYFKWKYNETETSNYTCNYMLDMINIEENPVAANVHIDLSNYVYNESCVGAKVKFPMEVQNTGAGTLQISGGECEGPFSCDYTGSIAANETAIVPVYFNPTEAGTFETTLTLNVGNATGNASIDLKATAIEKVSDFFENFDLKKEIPADWKAIQSSNSNHIIQNVWAVQGASNVYSAPYAIKINRINNEDLVEPVFLVSPGTENFGTNKLTFQAKKGGENYEMSLIVGVMSDPYDAESFIPKETIDLTSDFIKYEVTFKQNTAGPYIGFKFGEFTPAEPFPYPSIRIDDVSWEEDVIGPPEPAVVAAPLHDATNIDIYRDVKLRWAAGSANTNGYFISIGTTEAANDIINKQDINSNPLYTVDYDFAYSTKYYWKVIPYNEHGECVTGIETWSFTTMADPTISSYPFAENFDEVDNVPSQKDCPLGWTILDVDDDLATWDMINFPPAMPGITHNDSRGCMHVLYSNYKPKDDWLFTPPLVMDANKSYNAEFFLHTIKDISTGQFYNEEVEMWIGTEKNAAGMTIKLAEDNVNTATWKKVEEAFTVAESGTYYIGIHAVSEPAAYLLIVDDFKLEESTSLTEQALNSSLQLNPNPASGSVNIKFNNEHSLATSIEVIDLTGQKVFANKTCANEYTLDLSGYKSGIYFVLVNTTQGQLVKKLVVE